MALYLVVRNDNNRVVGTYRSDKEPPTTVNDNNRVVGTYRSDKEPPTTVNKTIEQVTKADMLDTLAKLQEAAEIDGYVTRINGVSTVSDATSMVLLDCDNIKIRPGEATDIVLRAKGGPASVTINGKSVAITDTFTITIAYM